MASIDELRDIVFYVIRKLNDLIINFTREEQPQPQPQRRVIPDQFPNLTIDERIERIRRSLNGEEQPPQIVTEDPLTTNLDIEEPPSSPIEERDEVWERIDKEIEESIEDLQKQKKKNMKETILDYLLKRIVKLTEVKADDKLIKELKPNDIIITELQNEFDRLRLETERIDVHLVNMDELKRKYKRN